MTTKSYTVTLRTPHEHQRAFIDSDKPRIIVRAGRRSGKTVGVAEKAVVAFLSKKRVLYAAPTAEQLATFWFEVKRALAEPIAAGHLVKNETDHIIEVPNTKQRIRAKTAWNADTLRGDYADLLIIDEWQLANEDSWELVGQPMLLDNNGSAIFIYTPPSLHSRSVSKARDPRHAAKMFTRAQSDTSGRWAAYHFSSHENPYISRDALGILAEDMTTLAYRQELLAEDVTEAPGALWKQEWIDVNRVSTLPVVCSKCGTDWVFASSGTCGKCDSKDSHSNIVRVVVAIDPAVSSTEQSDETGIVVTARSDVGHGYVLADASGRYSPRGWAERALRLVDEYKADQIIAESNNGGDMVAETIHASDPDARVKLVHASRGKAARAEPIAALYEHGKIHHVGPHLALEEQLITWEPLSGVRSPDRLDACVWGLSELFPQHSEVRYRRL